MPIDFAALLLVVVSGTSGVGRGVDCPDVEAAGCVCVGGISVVILL